jgi:hypothetical protein
MSTEALLSPPCFTGLPSEAPRPAAAGAPPAPPPIAPSLLLALAGASAAGLAAGLPASLSRGLSGALLLPGLLFEVAVVTGPALYIALAITDAIPTAQRFAGEAAKALGDVGALLFGLSPAVLFLGLTSGHPTGAPAAAFGAVAFAGLSALGRLQARLAGRGETPATRISFAAWALVATGIGAFLFAQQLLFVAPLFGDPLVAAPL